MKKKPAKRRTKFFYLAAASIIPTALVTLGLGDLAMRTLAMPPANPTSFRGQDGLEDRLAQIVADFGRHRERWSHTAQWEVARDLEERALRLGYKVWVQSYDHQEERWPNVIVAKAPLSATRPYVVAMAHFDSISGDREGRSPGADDNAAGVAVVLELARLFSDIETDRPLVFCFFSKEETGRPGSKAFTNWAKKEGIDFAAAVNVDTVGYNSPERLLDWAALTVHRSWRGRLGALRNQLKNGLLAMYEGRDALLVAGRGCHEPLVGRVAAALAESGELSVTHRARDDCG